MAERSIGSEVPHEIAGKGHPREANSTEEKIQIKDVHFGWTSQEASVAVAGVEKCHVAQAHLDGHVADADDASARAHVAAVDFEDFERAQAHVQDCAFAHEGGLGGEHGPPSVPSEHTATGECPAMISTSEDDQNPGPPAVRTGLMHGLVAHGLAPMGLATSSCTAPSQSVEEATNVPRRAAAHDVENTVSTTNPGQSQGWAPRPPTSWGGMTEVPATHGADCGLKHQAEALAPPPSAKLPQLFGTSIPLVGKEPASSYRQAKQLNLPASTAAESSGATEAISGRATTECTASRSSALRRTRSEPFAMNAHSDLVETLRHLVAVTSRRGQTKRSLHEETNELPTPSTLHAPDKTRGDSPVSARRAYVDQFRPWPKQEQDAGFVDAGKCTRQHFTFDSVVGASRSDVERQVQSGGSRTPASPKHQPRVLTGDVASKAHSSREAPACTNESTSAASSSGAHHAHLVGTLRELVAATNPKVRTDALGYPRIRREGSGTSCSSTGPRRVAREDSGKSGMGANSNSHDDTGSGGPCEEIPLWTPREYQTVQGGDSPEGASPAETSGGDDDWQEHTCMEGRVLECPRSLRPEIWGNPFNHPDERRSLPQVSESSSGTPTPEGVGSDVAVEHEQLVGTLRELMAATGKSSSRPHGGDASDNQLSDCTSRAWPQQAGAEDLTGMGGIFGESESDAEELKTSDVRQVPSDASREAGLQADSQRVGAQEDAQRGTCQQGQRVTSRAGTEGSDKNAEDINDPTELCGVLWKKCSNLSRSTKLLRLLRREAESLLSQAEDSVFGLGLDRISHLAAEVMALLRNKQPPSVETLPHVGRGLWNRCHVSLLRSGTLTWMKLNDSDHIVEESVKKAGPLAFGSVEYVGIHCSGTMQIFRVYLASQAWHKPLTFAAESGVDVERWVSGLRAAVRAQLPPAPPRRPLWDRFVDLYNCHAPPKGCEAPPATLNLEIISAVGMPNKGSSDELMSHGEVQPGASCCRNLYVRGRVCNTVFRTTTRYDCCSVANLGHTFAIPLTLESPDELIRFEVLHESEYDDCAPTLLGAISIPLFAFRRGARISFSLPLKQDHATRSGLVNTSFGHLNLAGTLCQPIGYLWLPVELQQADEAPCQNQQFDYADLETQVNRIDALVELLLMWIMHGARILQWSHFWHSLAWFLFLELWILLAWSWSLTFVATMLLKATLDARPPPTFRRQNAHASNVLRLPGAFVTAFERAAARGPGATCSAPHAAPPQGAVWTLPGGDNQHRSPTKSGALHATPPRSCGSVRQISADGAQETAGTGSAVDMVIWEAERRIIFGGFSAHYLVDGLDLPQWANEDGQEVAGPLPVIWQGGQAFRYQWKVVVNETTDENGWQYAFAFADDAQWRVGLDAARTWVRRRQHHGRFLHAVNASRAEEESSSYDGTTSGEMRRAGFHATGVHDDPNSAFAFQFPDLSMAADPKTYGRATTVPPSPGLAAGSEAAQSVELTLTENDQIRNHIQLYLMIRNDVEFILSTLEKYKNLFSWKDETVTGIVVLCLFSAILLSLFIPTGWVVAFLIALAFYIGSFMGERKRQNRDKFLQAVALWSSSVCRDELHIRGADRCSILEERGLTRLALRDWCNATFGTKLDLRSVDRCCTFAELADLVVQASGCFEKTPKRYRSWHSDLYNNFMDHVPSDTADNDAGSMCYRFARGGSSALDTTSG